MTTLPASRTFLRDPNGYGPVGPGEAGWTPDARHLLVRQTRRRGHVEQSAAVRGPGWHGLPISLGDGQDKPREVIAKRS